jgi:hypothetical protein
VVFEGETGRTAGVVGTAAAGLEAGGVVDLGGVIDDRAGLEPKGNADRMGRGVCGAGAVVMVVAGMTGDVGFAAAGGGVWAGADALAAAGAGRFPKGNAERMVRAGAEAGAAGLVLIDVCGGAVLGDVAAGAADFADAAAGTGADAVAVFFPKEKAFRMELASEGFGVVGMATDGAFVAAEAGVAGADDLAGAG